MCVILEPQIYLNFKTTFYLDLDLRTFR